MLLEDALDGLEIDLGGQVGHREVLLVERARGARLLDVAPGQMTMYLRVRPDVPAEVHRHEGAQLHEPGIHEAPGSPVWPGNAIDEVLPEPLQRMAGGQQVDRGGAHAGVD